MKPLYIFLILSLISTALTLIIYFGIVRRNKVDDEPVSSGKSRYRNYPTSIGLPEYFTLVTSQGTHVKKEYTLKVTETEIKKLPGYTKYECETEYPYYTKYVRLGHHEIDIPPITFLNATIYNWHRETLLLIINASETSSKGDTVRSYYYKRAKDIKENFRMFQTDIEFENEDKILEFIKKLNLELYNVFPFDIGMKMNKQQKKVRFENSQKVQIFTKKEDQFSPYVSIEMIVSDSVTNRSFQISDFTYKGYNVELEAPEETLIGVIVHSWNGKPLLIDLVTYPRSHSYYRQTGNLQWTVMLDPFNENNSQSEMNTMEIRETLESINYEVNDTNYVELSKVQNYIYKSAQILVSSQEIKSQTNTYVKYIHRMKTPEIKFIIGGYQYNSTFYKELPLGVRLDYLSVYTLNELPIMLEMEVLKEKNKEKSTKTKKEETENGEEKENKETGEQEGDQETKQDETQPKEETVEVRYKRYFFFNKMSKWEEFGVEGEEEEIENNLVVEMDVIAGYLGPIIVLDLDKKESYSSNNENKTEETQPKEQDTKQEETQPKEQDTKQEETQPEQPTEEQEGEDTKQNKEEKKENENRKITVTLKKKIEHYVIYTHKPPSKDSSGSQIDNQSTVLRVMHNGRILVGILPTTIKQADVFLNLDSIPVAVDIFTGFERKGYQNEGEYVWANANYKDGELDMTSLGFEVYARKYNTIMSFDIGNLSNKNTKNMRPYIRNTEVGNHIRVDYRLSCSENFILDELRFKGVKYSSFDTLGLFSHRIQSIHVYYTRDSLVPVIMSLNKYRKSIVYNNNFKGKWVRSPLYDSEYFRSVQYFNLYSLFVKGVINIDNYVDYSSTFKVSQIGGLVNEKLRKEKEEEKKEKQRVVIEEIPNSIEEENNKFEGKITNKKVEVIVTKSTFSGDYTKCVHSLTSMVNPSAIIHRGFGLKGLPELKKIETLTVYFKKNIHIPLYLEITASRTIHHFVNEGNDRWREVDASRPVLESLKEAERVLSETEMWKTTEKVPDDKMNLELKREEEEEECKEEEQQKKKPPPRKEWKWNWRWTKTGWVRK